MAVPRIMSARAAILAPRITNASWVGSTLGKSIKLNLPICQIRKGRKDCKVVHFEVEIRISYRAAILAPRFSYASWLGSTLKISTNQDSFLFVRSRATEKIAKKVNFEVEGKISARAAVLAPMKTHGCWVG